MGFDVPVNDAVVVGHAKGLHHVRSDRGGHLWWQHAKFLHATHERAALEHFHHDETPVSIGPDVVHRDDVRVVKPGHGARLDLETLSNAGPGRKVRGQQLDCALHLQTGIVGPVDRGHSAHTQLPDQSVSTFTKSGRNLLNHGNLRHNAKRKPIRCAGVIPILLRARAL